MKLLHVTIQTSRFEEEIAFYRDIACLSVERDMRPAGRSMVFLSDAAGDTCIEIIGAPGAAACNAPDLSIGFKTEDAQALREKLRQRGFRRAAEMSWESAAEKLFQVYQEIGAE